MVVPQYKCSHLVDGGDDLEQVVVGQVLERELPLRHVPRVSLPQHRVAVPGDHLPGWFNKNTATGMEDGVRSQRSRQRQTTNSSILKQAGGTPAERTTAVGL